MRETESQLKAGPSGAEKLNVYKRNNNQINFLQLTKTIDNSLQSSISFLTAECYHCSARLE